MVIGKKAALLVVIVFNVFLYSNAQDIKVPQNALLSQLLRNSDLISRIPISKDPIIPQPAPFTNNFQQLIKSKTGLYLCIDGTGRVYKAKSWDDKWVNFEKIDYTTFFGSNKGSQKFIIGDTLFSFGGYGFWHFNGSLSYFTYQKEWEMLPLNKEIPFFEINDRISSISQYDVKNDLFYFSAMPIGQQTVINAAVNDSFYVFDVRKRNVWAIGKSVISKEDYMRFAEPHKVETPWGLLMDSPYGDHRDYLLSLKDNLMYVSESRIIQQLIPSSKYSKNNLMFYQNGYLYASAYPFDRIDSLKFDIGKFKLLNTTIYSTKKKLAEFTIKTLVSKYGIAILIMIIVILLIIIGYLFHWKKKSKSTKDIPEKAQQEELLSPLEKQLLKQFISKIEKNQTCSTDELNSMLGVALKSIEIKKKARTDFITKVNHKLKQNFLVSDDIIIRNRSEEDKRSYLYSIDPDLIIKIKKLLSN